MNTGWDGESLISRRDAETGVWIFVALHSSRLGPASGGTRMIAYPDLEAARRDAMRLSEGMTYKWAAAGFPRGGGKAVIAAPPGLDRATRQDLLRRYGAFVRELNGRFWTGADAGTTAEDMDVIAETGAPYIFSRTPAHGGAGGPESGPRWVSSRRWPRCAGGSSARRRSRAGPSSCRESAASVGPCSSG